MDADVIIVGAGPVGLMLAGERGQDPAAEALRELVGELLADEQPLRRLGALIAGTSIRYPMPGPSQHALGRGHRRTRRHGRARVARSALELVRRTPGRSRTGRAYRSRDNPEQG